MQKRYALLALAAALILAPNTLQAASDSPWIHIQVREDSGSQTKVDVNLPLSVVQVALDVAPERIISDGHIKIDHHGHHDLSISDLRRMWQELRDAGEAEFVTLEEDDEKALLTWGVKSLPWLILTNRTHVVCAEGFSLGDLDNKLGQKGQRCLNVFWADWYEYR